MTSEASPGSVASYALLMLLVLGLIVYISRGYWLIVHSLAMTAPAVDDRVGYETQLESVSVTIDRDTADFFARFRVSGTSAETAAGGQRTRPSGVSLGSPVMQLQSFLQLPAEPSLASLDSRRLSSLAGEQQLQQPDPAQLQFSDISKSRRFSHQEALKRRRDQVSLRLAVRRSLVSFLLLMLPTLPYLVACAPGLLASQADQRLLAVHKAVTALFYLNTVLVPLWYLLFSRRLRRCFVDLVTGA